MLCNHKIIYNKTLTILAVNLISTVDSACVLVRLVKIYWYLFR